jgi:hypothetical protein
VRYLRCPVDHLPSIPELQLLVPQSTAASRLPHPAPSIDVARDALAGTASSSRRRDRGALWHDSGFFQDSFFGSESRSDSGRASEFGSMLRSGVSVHELDMPAGSEESFGDAQARRAPPTRH